MPSPLKRARTNTGGRDSISEFTTERLSIYLRCLTVLEGQHVTKISSQGLASRFHLTSSQIRKDLACIGELGIRGVGYSVSDLKSQLTRTLGLDTVRPIVIFGAGNLGVALADHHGFNTSGFVVAALFDDDRGKQGQVTRSGIPIHPVERLREIVAAQCVEIGIIAVPPEAAHAVYDLLVAAGITAILNFSPVQLPPRPEVTVTSVDLRIQLESLSFALAQAK